MLKRCETRTNQDLISFSFALFSIAGITFLVEGIALYLVTSLNFIRTRYIAAAGLGLSLFFWYDTINDAIQLDVNQEFTGGWPHVAHVLVFAAGFVALVIFDHFAVRRPASSATGNNSPSTPPKALFLIPVAVASVMGIHSLAESWAFGSTAVYATNLVSTYGGILALISYPLHKFFEATIIAILYAVYVKRSNIAKEWWHLPLLLLLFSVPTLIGVSIGYQLYNSSFDITYFYAFGVTSAVYAVLRLVEPVNLKFKLGENAPAYLGWKIFLAVFIGFMFLYIAGLFH